MYINVCLSVLVCIILLGFHCFILAMDKHRTSELFLAPTLYLDAGGGQGVRGEDDYETVQNPAHHCCMSLHGWDV